MRIYNYKLNNMNNIVIYNNKEYKIFDNNFPFHNEKFMMIIMTELLDKADIFVETGTQFGNTSQFVGLNFNNLKVFTCEFNEENYNQALNKLSNISNITALFEKSPDALYKLENYYDKDIYNKNIVFWIDAHCEYDVPLNNEIDYITKNFNNYCIFIDDFTPLDI